MSGHDIEQCNQTAGQAAGQRAVLHPAGMAYLRHGAGRSYGLISAWRLVGDYGLPDSVFYLIYGGLAADIVTILWGLYLLGLAFNRSARFPAPFHHLADRHHRLAAGKAGLCAGRAGFRLLGQGLGHHRGRDRHRRALHLSVAPRFRRRDRLCQSGNRSPPVFVSIVAALLGIILGAVDRRLRRLRRRLADRRCHRHELLRGRLRLFCRCSSAWPGWLSAPSPAACSPSGASTGESGSRRHGSREGGLSNSRVAIARRAVRILSLVSKRAKAREREIRGKVWMFRFIFRLAAMVALSVSVIMAVLDATRSVAASALVMTPLNTSWLAVSPDTRAPLKASSATRPVRCSWDGAIAWVLNQPGFAVFAVLAFLLYAIGYRRQRRSGSSHRAAPNSHPRRGIPRATGPRRAAAALVPCRLPPEPTTC